MRIRNLKDNYGLDCLQLEGQEGSRYFSVSSVGGLELRHLRRPVGLVLHRLIEGCSWGMKESQEMEQKDKVKTDQKVLVMSRVGGLGPQGKSRRWRINR